MACGASAQPDPESGGERLRERPEVDDALGVERAQRVGRGLVEVQQPVGVVLEHEDLVRPTDLEDLGTPLEPTA